jgi:hypothetical protein
MQNQSMKRRKERKSAEKIGGEAPSSILARFPSKEIGEDQSMRTQARSFVNWSGRMTLLLGSCLLVFTAGCKPTTTLSAKGLIVVEEGTARMPIVVFENAPPFTRQAVEDLANYIEKTSGARPEVLEGLPDPIPEHAIWVGYQPKLKELFPDVDFDFKHPEEILISANENHLVIAGRDRWDPEHMTMKDRRGKEIVGVQQEYGTVNAVYTFLQDHLGVRWLWPGELGEDIVKQATIGFAPFTERYHPQIRGRQFVFMIYTLEKNMGGNKWARHQRLQLDSLFIQPGHPFSDWWDRFHETNPEFFALREDGTRSQGPSARTVKICKSSPAVWEQWMKDVEAQMASNPDRRTFAANANDGWTYGYCTDEPCRAWDPPEGSPTIHYVDGKGTARKYVSMTDRQITFANTLARMLRERFPDRDDLLVSAMAYGASRTPPVTAIKPDANVIVSGVWSFHNQPNDVDRESFVEWSKISPLIAWRPNLTSRAGWKAGFPNSAPRRVIEDLRFAAEHNIIGMSVDWIFESWAAQGPHYYMLAQMVWNPYADGEAILADYYQRAFGPAAKTMIGYWEAIGNAATRIGYEGKSEREVWNQAFFDDAYARLDQATAEATEDGPLYGKRVAFVRAGLDYLRLIREMEPFIDRMAETKGKDAEAKAAAQAKWEEIFKEIERIKKEYPFAISGSYVSPGNRYLKNYSPDQFTEKK